MYITYMHTSLENNGTFVTYTLYNYRWKVQSIQLRLI